MILTVYRRIGGLETLERVYQSNLGVYRHIGG